MATGSQAESTRARGRSVSLLTIEDLKVAFDKGGGRLLPVIDGVSLELGANEAVGVVGESGSGKTMLCRSIVGTLARRGARVTSGRILLEGRDLADAPESVWRTVRGKKIGYVPQSSLAGLNPVLSIRTQLIESITVVRPLGRDEAMREALRLLDIVRIPRACRDRTRDRVGRRGDGSRCTCIAIDCRGARSKPAAARRVGHSGFWRVRIEAARSGHSRTASRDGASAAAEWCRPVRPESVVLLRTRATARGSARSGRGTSRIQRRTRRDSRGGRHVHSGALR